MDIMETGKVRRMLLAFALFNIAALGPGAKVGTDKTGYLSFTSGAHIVFARGELSPSLVGAVLAVAVIAAAVLLAWKDSRSFSRLRSLDVVAPQR